MSIRVGIVGISGFGGGEAMRLVASHPSFELIYAAGEGSAGSRLVDRFPGVPAKLAELVIEKWDPVTLPKLDVLFASLPTGASAEALARVPKDVKIVDIGGDHRYVEGWAYGLADVWPAQIEGQIRVANPGCFPAATLNALAPLLVKHVHMPEIAKTIERLSGGSAAGLVFTPHLVPMTRGVLATIYCRGRATTGQCLDAARHFYAARAFVRVTDKPPQTKWATGSNLAFVSYAADPERNLVIAMGVVDNLGKGAAGQAVQTANLICGLLEAAGLAIASGPRADERCGAQSNSWAVHPPRPDTVSHHGCRGPWPQ